MLCQTRLSRLSFACLEGGARGLGFGLGLGVWVRVSASWLAQPHTLPAGILVESLALSACFMACSSFPCLNIKSNKFIEPKFCTPTETTAGGNSSRRRACVVVLGRAFAVLNNFRRKPPRAIQRCRPVVYFFPPFPFGLLQSYLSNCLDLFSPLH